MRLGALAAAIAVAACSPARPAEARASLGALVSTAVWNVVEATPIPSDVAPLSHPVDAIEPAVAFEATRVRAARIDSPELAPFASRVAAHFGAAKDLSLQRADLPAGARALLITSAADEARALLLVVDAQGALLWFKDLPLAGVLPGARHLTLAAGGSGRVHLLFHASKWVAARTWLADGSILSDHVLFEADTSSAIAAVQLPGVGLVAVASLAGGPRAQLLGDDGLKWGETGAAVGSVSGDPGPVTLAADAEGWTLVQHAIDGRGGHDLLAFRYDERAIPVWPAPVDLGPVVRASDDDRIRLAPASLHRTLVGPFRARSGQPRRVLLSRSGNVTHG